MHEAKTNLSQLVERVEAGEEIVTARNGTPVARLVPVARTNALDEVYGRLKGRIHLGEDFDELPEDIADGFGAR